MSTEALERAVAHAGSQKALADKLGVKQSVVWYWLKNSKRGCPAEQVLKIEEFTGGAVRRHELRPDLWPPEPTPIRPSQSIEPASREDAA